MNIVGKKITLRAVEENDLPLLHEWSNDPDIWNLLGGWHFPYSLASAINWFKSIDNNNFKSQVYAIEIEDKKIIGTVSLSNIDWKNKNAFYGIMIGNNESRGHGYGYDACLTIMRYAFEELGLNRLDTEIIEYNNRSLYFHIEKCGWINEGIKKEAFFRKGQFWDKVILGITSGDYHNLANKSGN